jgi:CysZ protein
MAKMKNSLQKPPSEPQQPQVEKKESNMVMKDPKKAFKESKKESEPESELDEPKRTVGDIASQKAEQIKNMVIKDAEKGASLFKSVKYLFSNGKLVVASLAAVLFMILLSILMYHQISSWFNSLTVAFFDKPPALDAILDYIYYAGWWIVKILFKAIVIIVSFYVSFVISYTVCSPLYSFISIIAEDIHFGKPDDNADFNFEGVVEDVFQAMKIAGITILLSVGAFFINFIPVVGQIMAITIYIWANSLMLIDFPASRRRWAMKRKLLWTKDNPIASLRIGALPTLLSMLPFINIILLAFLFPLLVVHSTLNFVAYENRRKNKKPEIAEADEAV